MAQGSAVQCRFGLWLCHFITSTPICSSLNQSLGFQKLLPPVVVIRIHFTGVAFTREHTGLHPEAHFRRVLGRRWAGVDFNYSQVE
jgi:hypothetical protein